MGQPTWATQDPWTRALDEIRRTGTKIPLPSEGDTRKTAASLARGLVHSDIAKRELARQVEAERPGAAPYRIRTPGQVLGERNLQLTQLLMSSLENRLITARGAPIGTEEAIGIAVRAMTASPYLWLDRVEDEVNASPLPPRHVVSRGVLPEPRMWWTTENSYDMHDERGVAMVRDATVVSDEGDAITVFTLGKVGGTSDEAWQKSAPCILAQSIPYGMTYPDDCADEGVLQAMGQMLGKLAFLNSPYIPKQRHKATRAERRGGTREGHDLDDVTFVDLRRPASTGHNEPENEHDIDWQHQWVVHGHYRAQWYPSESAHHVIYIAPYLKGPEDKPLLEHTYRVKR